MIQESLTGKCNDYVSIVADGTSVSSFLCTQKLGPEEVSITCLSAQKLKYSFKVLNDDFLMHEILIKRYFFSIYLAKGWSLGWGRMQLQ